MQPATPRPDVALRFPRQFVWGAATAAHQVEGNNVASDWWEWERQPGRIRTGEVSGEACDHYRRYRQDFDLLAALGHTAHRLSLEWSRLEPRPGAFDPAAISHYRDVLEALRERGIEPFVTLHHFTNPRWLAREGDWRHPAVVGVFARFAARMASEYHDLVRYWITINEPTVFAYHGYLLGERPPGVRSAGAMLRVLRHLAQANRVAYRAIKAVDPDAWVGAAHQRTVFDPARPRHPADRAAARVRLWLVDEACTAAFASHEDFAGVNYYTRGITRFDPRTAERLFAREVAPAPGALRNTLGWEVYPRGLYQVLVRAAARGHRIIVTENGVPDQDDELRPSALVQHLREVHRAIQAGAPVAGYLHWTSLDNFEWTEGFGPRFGLIAVDRATQERRPKPSAYLYADIIRANALEAEVLRRYTREAD